jgi:hypothetical protein
MSCASPGCLTAIPTRFVSRSASFPTRPGRQLRDDGRHCARAGSAIRGTPGPVAPKWHRAFIATCLAVAHTPPVGVCSVSCFGLQSVDSPRSVAKRGRTRHPLRQEVPPTYARNAFVVADAHAPSGPKWRVSWPPGRPLRIGWPRTSRTPIRGRVRRHGRRFCLWPSSRRVWVGRPARSLRTSCSRPSKRHLRRRRCCVGDKAAVASGAIEFHATHRRAASDARCERSMPGGSAVARAGRRWLLHRAFTDPLQERPYRLRQFLRVIVV